MTYQNDQVSEDFKEQLFRQQTSRTLKHLIDVRIKEGINAEFSIYRFVDNYTPIRFQAPNMTSEVLYQPAAFKISLGNDDAERTPQVTLDLDSGDRDTIRRLRRAEGTVFVSISLVLVPQGGNPLITHREFGPTELVVESISFKSTAISARLVVEPFLTEPAPSTLMTPTIAPGLYDNVAVDG